GAGDPAAEAVFEEMRRLHDLAEAWFGLAAVRWKAGDVAGAAAALGALFGRHAPRPGFAELAGRVAAAAGMPGWCGVDAAGRLSLSVAADATVALDGVVLRRPRIGRGAVLPARWRRASRLEAWVDGQALLGSPVALDAVRRVEGFVEAEVGSAKAGGLRGWAWHPADPATDPVLSMVAGPGRIGLVASERVEVTDPPAMAQLRGFSVPAAALARFAGPVRVTDAQEQDVLGSPLDPQAERRSAAAAAGAVRRLFPVGSVAGRAEAAGLPAVPADVVGAPAQGRPRPRGLPVVVVPAYRGMETTRACLESVLATVPRGVRVIVVDDASPEPELAAMLDRLAARRRIVLLRQTRNRGFPASANAGIRAAAGRDVVLLNSDTLVPPGWMERLRDAAYAAGDIGTVTPLSNDATLVSYPRAGQANPPPDPAGTRRLDALAWRANGGAVVDIPTGVGFCLYLRRDCLEATGLLREDVFAQGYGEENDFCLRARHLGWRHVALPGLFVAHLGGASFGGARGHLIRRNLAILNRLHPGYDALIAAHAEADPLAPARRRIDLARWKARRRAGVSVILVSHDQGGGVERQVAARCAALAGQGLHPVVLRPAPGGCRVESGTDADFPNLCFALPAELPALARLLRAGRPAHLEVHHLLGHAHAVLDLARLLGLPVDVHVHDYAALCPRISLLGPAGRYCGEPAVAVCEACVADAGSRLEEEIGVAALRARSAAGLAAARRVVVPAADVAGRLARHFPGLRAEVRPWEDDAAIPPPAPRARPGKRLRVAVVGGIGAEKGYDVLLEAARDAAWRDLPLDFIVVGHTHDDARLLATGRAFITGRFAPEEAEALIRAQRADFAFLPSVWPETWCFALSDAWRAGLGVAAFDLGAPAERIRQSGRGWLLPYGMPAPALNAALLAIGADSGNVGANSRDG
ncbi:MAG TPA: glycosyltransferase, partial [Acetobacteraceae bacterium]|nr:glycosyltransferase [Acetobacteraceae bacterium]